jgi:flagellar hook-associated protein 3 FlgL
MRVTFGMLSSSMVNNLNTTLDRLNTSQLQASSGKRINKASDDPQGTGQALDLRSTLSNIDQYLQNIQDVKPRISMMDSAMGDITKTLQETKQIALAAASSTTTDDQRQTMAVQVQQKIDNIVGDVNTSYNNRRLFSGFQTDKDAVTPSSGGATPYQYNGDDGKLKVSVNDNTEIEVGVTAKDVLNMNGATDPSQPDILTTLTNLKQDILNNNQNGIDAGLKQLDFGFANVNTLRGKLGIRSAQMDVYYNRLDDSKVSLSDSLSKVEDADITQVVIQLQTEQNAYQASLIATSRMDQQSLADYLK